jgi:hypothetical protein
VWVDVMTWCFCVADSIIKSYLSGHANQDTGQANDLHSTSIVVSTHAAGRCTMLA